MKLNGAPINRIDLEVMIEFLQVMASMDFNSKALKETLFILRQTLMMSGLSTGGVLQVEPLDAILKNVTFEVGQLKLWKKPIK